MMSSAWNRQNSIQLGLIIGHFLQLLANTHTHTHTDFASFWLRQLPAGTRKGRVLAKKDVARAVVEFIMMVSRALIQQTSGNSLD